MFDGRDGPAKQKAMDLLMRYGEALGAERLVETQNVAGAFNASTPSVRALVAKGYDAVFPSSTSTATRSCRSRRWRSIPASSSPASTMRTGASRASPTSLPISRRTPEAHFGALGINMFATCTPYQVGNVPVKRRALRLDGILRRRLLQLRSRRAHQHRRQGKHRRRRADRPHSVLGFSHPRKPARHPSGRSRHRGRRHHGLGPARLLAGGDRAGGYPGAHRQAAPAEPDQAQAFRRGRRIVGRRRDVSHPGRHAGSDATSRRRSADARSPGHASLRRRPSANSPTTRSTVRPSATSIS